MTDQQAILHLRDLGMMGMAEWLQERLLSEPRSGEQPDPLYSSSEAPLPDQAKPAPDDMLMVAAHLRHDAHWHRNSLHSAHPEWAAIYENAAAYLEYRAELQAGLSVAQSAAVEAQAACRHCGQGLAEDGVCENLECHPYLAAEAEGASGSDNGEAEAPGGGEK